MHLQLLYALIKMLPHELITSHNVLNRLLLPILLGIFLDLLAEVRNK